MYHRPATLFNPHLETIYPSLLRKVKLVPYKRERISTPDDDFLDVDWLIQGSSKVVIISHGLEGNTARPYVRGMARAFFQKGYDVAAWNYRGCSDEMNRNLRFYHSGATDDLACVIQHVTQQNRYSEIFLVGFSLGGNLTLKFLGENGDQLPAPLKKAMAFSVPMDLHSSCLKISSPSNWLYSNRFLKSLKSKIIRKAAIRSGLDTRGISAIKTLMEFDDRFTAPLHGFKDALDYYAKSSSINFLNGIKVPTLIVSAKNDPFLSPACFPTKTDFPNQYLTMNFPSFGGHVGFTLFNQNGLYWSELKALEFFESK